MAHAQLVPFQSGGPREGRRTGRGRFALQAGCSRRQVLHECTRARVDRCRRPPTAGAVALRTVSTVACNGRAWAGATLGAVGAAATRLETGVQSREATGTEMTKVDESGRCS